MFAVIYVIPIITLAIRDTGIFRSAPNITSTGQIICHTRVWYVTKWTVPPSVADAGMIVTSYWQHHPGGLCPTKVLRCTRPMLATAVRNATVK